MKSAKTLAVATAMIVLVGVMVSGASAVGVNITIPDTFVTGLPYTNYNQGVSPKAGEDQETEGIPPNTVFGQNWDNEAFSLNGSRATATLQVLSGFNFQTGQQDPYRPQNTYLTGDIFIGTNPNWGTGRPSNNAPLLGRTSDGYVPTSNSLYNYNYVIHLTSNGTNITATAYSIDSTAALETNYFYAFDQVGPFKYVSGGTEVPNSSENLTQTTLSDADTPGYLGGTHYLLELQVGSWLPDGTYYFHYNYGCGNDLLMGRGVIDNTHPTPVPASVLLLGTGLAGLVFWRKRRVIVRQG